MFDASLVCAKDSTKTLPLCHLFLGGVRMDWCIKQLGSTRGMSLINSNPVLLFYQIGKKKRDIRPSYGVCQLG